MSHLFDTSLLTQLLRESLSPDLETISNELDSRKADLTRQLSSAERDSVVALTQFKKTLASPDAITDPQHPLAIETGISAALHLLSQLNDKRTSLQSALSLKARISEASSAETLVTIRSELDGLDNSAHADELERLFSERCEELLLSVEEDLHVRMLSSDWLDVEMANADEVREFLAPVTSFCGLCNEALTRTVTLLFSPHIQRWSYHYASQPLSPKSCHYVYKSFQIDHGLLLELGLEDQMDCLQKLYHEALCDALNSTKYLDLPAFVRLNQSLLPLLGKSLVVGLNSTVLSSISHGKFEDLLAEFASVRSLAEGQYSYLSAELHDELSRVEGFPLSLRLRRLADLQLLLRVEYAGLLDVDRVNAFANRAILDAANFLTEIVTSLFYVSAPPQDPESAMYVREQVEGAFCELSVPVDMIPRLAIHILRLLRCTPPEWLSFVDTVYTGYSWVPQPVSRHLPIESVL